MLSHVGLMDMMNLITDLCLVLILDVVLMEYVIFDDFVDCWKNVKRFVLFSRCALWELIIRTEKLEILSRKCDGKLTTGRSSVRVFQSSRFWQALS